ncbi:MAG: histidinol-phosphate transaminase [Janthinobacterium lividum]
MSPRPRPEIMAISPYVGGESLPSGANRGAKLSSNEGAFGPPPMALAAIAAAAATAHRYPDGSSAALRHAIATSHGLDAARIVCGNGSDELLAALCTIYGGPGTGLLMTEHGFSIYAIAGQAAGMRVTRVPERDLCADVDALLAAVAADTTLVFLANPNNPTGTLLPAAEVRRLRAHLPADTILVLDAAYAEYVDDPTYEAGAALVEAGDNTVMTRTFSKIYGLGGLRVGWAYAPAPVADALNRLRAPFNVNALALAAATAALSEPGWVENGRQHNTAQRARLARRLEAAGIRVRPGHANFLLADLDSAASADAADAFLRARGLIVRKVASYGLPSCLRITVGTADEVDLVADALAAFMAQAASQSAAPQSAA